MNSILRLHPLLEDMELRQAYLECEQSLGYKPKKGKCLMRNSGITIDDVIFSDEIQKGDIRYYFNTTRDWSDGTGTMRTDWVATIRNFARRDLRDGKLKMSANIQNGGSNLSSSKLPKDYGVRSPNAVPMPDSLKKRLDNIGK